MAARRNRRPVSSGDIAVVGMACLFPKSPDLRRYWQNILGRLDCIQEVPADRWDLKTFFNEDRLARDMVYSKWGSFLEAIRFDPMKWKIPPASLLSIDPIQLLSLEVASSALEDAGWDRRPFPKETTGCIFACAGTHDVGTDYSFRTMLPHYLPRVKDLSDEVRKHLVSELSETLPEWTEDSFPGFLLNVVAGRIANRFDLGGPNYVVDAACAASLAALHASIAQLRIGAVDAMIVGAADGTNNPFCYMSFAKTHALSPRGRSRPFDNSADGIALGEGIAAMVIRRLEDAERDGDQIYAVIKGIGASSDGRNRSMTAPHPPGQILAMQRAYDDAGVPAASVSLVEAHGTGTAVGDSTEITSLHTLFSAATDDRQYAAVGSVKSMIGHTKTAAGLASLVKTTLALHHRVLPPTLHVEKPNEKVDFLSSPFFVNSETRPWFDELGDHPRRAGISAFGFGGTNFHVVMEEYAGAASSRRTVDYSPRTAECLIFRRSDAAALKERLQALQSLLTEAPVGDWAQLAASIAAEEARLPASKRSCRLAIVAGSATDFLSKLAKALLHIGHDEAWQDPAGIYYSTAPAVNPERVAFLYPGQGSQQVNMLRDVATIAPWAQELFATANQQLAESLPKALTRYVYPPPVFVPAEEEARKAALNDTAVAQPALGLVELFATDVLARYGIRPAATAGHSYGEYVALHVAGAFDRQALLALSAERGRLSAEATHLCPGAMAAVPESATRTRELLAACGLKLELANLNAPNQTIIAGDVEHIERAMECFQEAGVRARRLAVTAAFHTTSMAPVAKAFAKTLNKTTFKAPQLPVYSNTLASPFPRGAAAIKRTLQRHLTEPVHFEAEVRQMRDDGYDVFIEVGPGRVLTGLLSRIFPQESPKVLTFDAPGQDGVTQLAHLLAQASVLGLPVELQSWYQDRGLSEEPVAEWVVQWQAAAKPKAHEWIISVHEAKPVSPLPTRPKDSNEGLRAKFGGTTATTVGNPSIPPKLMHSPANGNGNHADITSQSLLTAGNGKSVPTSPSTDSTFAVKDDLQPSTTNRLKAYSSTVARPAPGPAPLPPPQRRMNGTNGSQNTGRAGTTNPQKVEHSGARSTVADVRNTETVRPSGKSVVLTSPSAPLAPCLPLVTPPEAFAAMSISTRSRAVTTPLPAPTDPNAAMNPAAAQLILQSQALMMQLLDLQKWQQQVALRFVDAHSQLVAQCAGAFQGGALPAPQSVALPVPSMEPIAPAPMPVAMAPVAAPVTTPAPMPVAAAAAPVPVAAVPVPVAAHAPAAVPQPVVSRPVPAAVAAPAKPVAVAVTPRPVAAPAAAPAPVARAAAPAVAPPVGHAPGTNGSAVAAPATEAGPPSVEEFKADLLQAVSVRTGYPEEMLDITLPMESGLGIDSIKTVEIFSNLKKYHKFFQDADQDEEEALKEFTNFKTLGDILGAYELRYQAAVSGGGAAPAAASVQRYTLETVDAPANGQKKTTHASK